MEQFNYYVKDQLGESKTGLIEAINIRQASSLLHERGLIVIKLTPKKRGLNVIETLNNIRPVGLSDISTFTRQLSTMVSAGLSLVDTMLLLEKQTSNSKMKHAISEIVRDIQGGGSLAMSMAKHPQVFSSTYVSMVRAAESSGSLDKILNKLADTLERDREFRSKVVGALIYPAILIVVTILVVILVSSFVLPKLKDLFANSHTQLPLATRVLLGLTGIVSKLWIVFAVFVFGLIVVVRRLQSLGELKSKTDFIIMNIPYIGDINKSFSLSQGTRTLGLLVGSGVPIIEALKTSAEVTSNYYHKKAFLELAEEVQKGVPLNVPISKNPLFPPVVGQMVAVGEETGKLEEILERVAAYFEVEAEHKVRNFTTALEPMIIVLMALGVMFVLFAVVLPLYNLSSQLNG